MHAIVLNLLFCWSCSSQSTSATKSEGGSQFKVEVWCSRWQQTRKLIVVNYLEQIDVVDLSLEEEVVDSKHFITYKVRDVLLITDPIRQALLFVYMVHFFQFQVNSSNDRLLFYTNGSSFWFTSTLKTINVIKFNLLSTLKMNIWGHHVGLKETHFNYFVRFYGTNNS